MANDLSEALSAASLKMGQDTALARRAEQDSGDVLAELNLSASGAKNFRIEDNGLRTDSCWCLIGSLGRGCLIVGEIGV